MDRGLKLLRCGNESIRRAATAHCQIQKLMDEIDRAQEEFDDLVGGAAIPIVVAGSPEETALRNLLDGSAALQAHNALQPNPVRQYRVMDIQGTEVLADFS